MLDIGPRGHKVAFAAHQSSAQVVARDCAGLDDLIRQSAFAAGLRQQRTVFLDHFLCEANLRRMSAISHRFAASAGSRRRLLPGRRGGHLPESGLSGSCRGSNSDNAHTATKQDRELGPTGHLSIPRFLENSRLRQSVGSGTLFILDEQARRLCCGAWNATPKAPVSLPLTGTKISFLFEGLLARG
jgi:hypothetical protein